MIKFIVEHEDKKTKARAGRLITPHGEIETPIFMPVGTLGAVKGLGSEDLEDIGAQIILGNTYHLFARPGLDIIGKAGGLHNFMQWNKPLLTDSGGYQVFSLKDFRKITEEGAHFQSHVDGSKHWFTPESVVEAQRIIGSDITMPFDECVAFPCEKGEAAGAMHRTHRWLDRAIKAFRANPGRQALFGIIQGSTFEDLRLESTAYVSNADVDGIAIGGLSVGEPAEQMYQHTEVVANAVRRDKPLYLMGVGTPTNLIESVSRGVDMFDCVMPTRNARNGMVFTSQGRLHYKDGKYKEEVNRPLDPACSCPVCRKYSVAYLRHLFKCGHLTVLRLATLHNLYFYLATMREMRKAILEDRFTEWKLETLAGYDRGVVI